MLTQQFLLFLKVSFIILQHLGLRKPAIITNIVILYEKKFRSKYYHALLSYMYTNSRALVSTQ